MINHRKGETVYLFGTTYMSSSHYNDNPGGAATIIKKTAQSDSIIIPEGFRPKYEIVVPGIRDDGSGMLGFVVQPSGRIFLRATTLPAGKGFYLRAPYPAAIS